MADLTRLCMDGFCSDVPVYVAGENIVIDNAEISADLSNYYNKQQVDDLIGALENVRIEMVNELPQEGETNVIYMVPKEGADPDVYNEYIWVDGDPSGSFEKIGDTQIDLSNYYTKTETDDLLDAKQDVLTAGDHITISGNTISAEEQKWTKDYPTLGDASHAVIQNSVEYNTATGDYSLAEGQATNATGTGAHSEGRWTKANGDGSHAEGQNTTTQELASHAEGQAANALAQASHAEGYGSTASKFASHAEGKDTIASGMIAHAEGLESKALGDDSHSEGARSEAHGVASHAEGIDTKASTAACHAEGQRAYAEGYASHAQNVLTKASGDYQTAIGCANIEDSTGNYLFIVGNGNWQSVEDESTVNRSNAMTVDKSGNVVATAFNQSSDGRLKENVSELDIADVFMALNPVSFDWKEQKPDGSENACNDGKHHFGFVAQDVQSALESNGYDGYSIVAENSGYYSVNYSEIIPMCVKMIQDQQKEIARLKELIEG